MRLSTAIPILIVLFAVTVLGDTSDAQAPIPLKPTSLSSLEGKEILILGGSKGIGACASAPNATRAHTKNNN